MTPIFACLFPLTGPQALPKLPEARDVDTAPHVRRGESTSVRMVLSISVHLNKPPIQYHQFKAMMEGYPLDLTFFVLSCRRL